MGHLINMLDDDITTYFYHLKKLQLITWMLFLCSMRKGWGFKRLEELSGRKQKLASLLKMINDLRKIKRIGKSQSWVSSLMILKEDNFGISYRNLSHSHRPQFYLFVYLFIYLFLEGVLSHRQSANEIVNIFFATLSKKKTPGHGKKPVKTNFVRMFFREGRVLGVLEVSRSIGDGRFKRCGVSCIPDVMRCTLTDNDRYVSGQSRAWRRIYNSLVILA